MIETISFLREREDETQRLGQILQKVQTELLSTNAEKRRMEQDRNAFQISLVYLYMFSFKNNFTGESEKLKAKELELNKAISASQLETASVRTELKRVETELRVYQTKKTQLESQLEASRERESRLSGTVAEISRLKLDNEALVCYVSHNDVITFCLIFSVVMLSVYAPNWIH